MLNQVIGLYGVKKILTLWIFVDILVPWERKNNAFYGLTFNVHASKTVPAVSFFLTHPKSPLESNIETQPSNF